MSIFSKIMGFLEEPQETATKLSQEEFSLQQTRRFYFDKIDNALTRDGAIRSDDPDLLVYGIRVRDLLDCGVLDTTSWKWPLLVSNKVTYKNHTKVGDHYYLNGEYIGGCAYSLLKTFLDNPKRFKVASVDKAVYHKSHKEIISGKLLDTKTQIEFSGEESLCFGMPSKVTPKDVEIVCRFVRLYYHYRADRLDELKRGRKENALLRQYCTCED